MKDSSRKSPFGNVDFSAGYAIVPAMPPRIISRKEHRISRKQISPNALRTLYRLHENGFIAHLVGGCVRDLLMGRTPKDFDIVTDAAPGQIKRLFRNCRLVGRRFRLAHLQFQDEILEVSTFRALTPPPDGEEADAEGGRSRFPRHLKDETGMVLRDNYFGTPEEDALRRDFTINALAYNIADFSVIDYTGGLSDLDQRLIRPIGDPYVRFTEDPVRMLRAVRFAASHGFEIEAAAWESICELSPTISRASPERLYEEIQKVFLLGSGRAAFDYLERSGLLAGLFPDFSRALRDKSGLVDRVKADLEILDRQCRNGAPPTVPLFLAAFFGPVLEEAALELNREGIPHRQALESVCAGFLRAQCKTVKIHGRAGSRMGAILALQPSLQRRPPRRPARMGNRPEFADAVAYLRITAEASAMHREVVEWWDAFLSGAPLPAVPEAASNGADGNRRRRRRRHRRRPSPQAEMHDSNEEGLPGRAAADSGRV